MKLTRRDAVLGAVGGFVSGGAATALVDRVDPPNAWSDGDTLDDDAVATLRALAAVVYPSTVTASEEFVRGYLSLLGEDRRGRIADATADLNAYTMSTYGRAFDTVSADRRTMILRELGVGAVDPDPTGSVAARVRYHLVNGLLYALFTSPRGSRLVGIQNPIGYPGGYHGSDERGDGG